VDDPVRVRVREALQDLRRHLDRRGVAKLTGANAVAHRPARNVFVGDVDVAVVTRVRIRAQAPRMAESCRRLGLALGSGARLPFAGDDLQRDVEAVRLVTGEPNRARAAAAERLQRPVAAEHELTGRKGRDCCRHVRSGLGAAP
jgi:hypothetical protein